MMCEYGSFASAQCVISSLINYSAFLMMVAVGHRSEVVVIVSSQVCLTVAV